MNKNKLKKMKDSIFLDTDGDWESIASEISKERDELKCELNRIKDKKPGHSIEVDPKRCKNWYYSDRSAFELGDIEDLSEDIKKNGQLQPVIVRKIEHLDYDYEVIAGERRWRACKLANIPMKVEVTDKDDTGCIVIQTSENKKQSLSPYSLSKVYLKIMQDSGISQNKMATELSIPNSTFKDILSFTRVPQEVWDAVEDMSRVKPRTAAYIAKEAAKGQEYIQAFLALANKIREGAGADTLEKHIYKHMSNKKLDRNATYSYKNDSGELLFRISTQGRITLSKIITDKYSSDTIGEKLKEIFSID